MGRHFFYVKNVKMLASFKSFYYLTCGAEGYTSEALFTRRLHIRKKFDKNLFISIFICIFVLKYGVVVELVDTADLKSSVPKGTCGFDSHLRYNSL